MSNDNADNADAFDTARTRRNRIALAAVILLAPGGFILGATLAARHYHNRRRQARD